MPNMAELAQEYAELTEQQRRELDDIVDAAIARAAVCPLGKVFGPTTREVRSQS